MGKGCSGGFFFQFRFILSTRCVLDSISFLSLLSVLLVYTFSDICIPRDMSLTYIPDSHFRHLGTTAQTGRGSPAAVPRVPWTVPAAGYRGSKSPSRGERGQELTSVPTCPGQNLNTACEETNDHRGLREARLLGVNPLTMNEEQLTRAKSLIYKIDFPMHYTCPTFL